MHLCLEIVEILQFICDKLDRKNAFHLALAARAFLEPALDRIWHELDSFAPLVSCLPEDLVTAERVELDDDGDDFNVSHVRARSCIDQHHPGSPFSLPIIVPQARSRRGRPTPIFRLLCPTHPLPESRLWPWNHGPAN